MSVKTESVEKESGTEEERRMLEQGTIYMFYKVKKGVDEPSGLEDTQRMFLVLAPQDQKKWRLLIVGKKKLPSVVEGKRERPEWAFVFRVASKKVDSVAEALGEEARPCGEGVYGIYRHGSHVHLAYRLGAPQDAENKEVQSELGIRSEASFLASVKNPTRSRAKVGANAFPKDVFEYAFKSGRAWVPLDPPELLDVEGAELLLISDVRDWAAFESGELDEALDVLCKGGMVAEIGALMGLGLDLNKVALKPLFKGKWA